MLDVNRLKKGDILVNPDLNNVLGDIFIFKDIEQGKYIHFYCLYDVSHREFMVSRDNTHLLGDNVRKAYLEEIVLLENVMEEYHYYWDDEKEELVCEDDRAIGNPDITESDTSNGIMRIAHLNTQQIHTLENIIQSWNPR